MDTIRDLIEIRPFDPERDSIADLTGLLNRAYKPLADLGLQYSAAFQDETETLERIRGSRCFVCFLHDRLIGTITYSYPERWRGTPWFEHDRATFWQFAVDPRFQLHGVGSAMLKLVEETAVQDGVRELAVSTDEPATHLIQYYERRGYRPVPHPDSTRPDEVILSKTLHHPT
jgi:GNAT superfamily N-acetyltransferase